MKESKVSDFSTLIGIDWADKKHDICERTLDHKGYQYSVISSSPKSIHVWAMDLKNRHPNKPVAVACELQKGPLIYALAKYEHIVLFPVNPSTVAKYRDAFTHCGAKDDPSDARIQAEILEHHMDKLRLITPDTAEIRALTQHVENRRKLVQDRVDLTNKITATLKNYYPQILEWFPEKDTVIFCDFLSKWSTLSAAKKARKSTLLTFFNQHNSRYPEANERRIEAIKEAVELTDDSAVIEPNQLMTEIFILQLKLLIESISQMEKVIRKNYRAQSDSAIFDSLPGAGPQLAPRLMAAMGSNRDRYMNAAEIQKYAGVAPVIERSGQKSWTHWRYSCPKFLRQTFVEWAGHSIKYSFWAKAYYNQQVEKGKLHNTVIRSLAFKWIRILFKCWKERIPYDESKYLEALKAKGSPLLNYAVNG
jgi:transposase